MGIHFATVAVPTNRMSLCCSVMPPLHTNAKVRSNPLINYPWAKELCAKLLNELKSAPDSAIYINTAQQKNRDSINQLKTYMDQDDPGKRHSYGQAMHQAKDIIRNLQVKDMRSLIVGTSGNDIGVLMFEFEPQQFGNRPNHDDKFYIKFAPPGNLLDQHEMEEIYEAWAAEYDIWKDDMKNANERHKENVKKWGQRLKREDLPMPYPLWDTPEWDQFWKANMNRRNWYVYSFHDGHHMNWNRRY